MEQQDGTPEENVTYEHQLTPRADAALLELCMRNSMSKTDALCSSVIKINDLERECGEDGQLAVIRPNGTVTVIAWGD